MRVKVSAGFCCQVPANPAKTCYSLGLKFRFGYRLRGNGHRSTVVVGNCTFRTDNGGTSPSSKTTF
jgi:hypothetical protein